MTKINKPPGAAGRAGEGSVEHMGEREVLILTREEAVILEMFLDDSTEYRQEQEASCKRVAEMTNEDGTPKFPSMISASKRWGKDNRILDGILRKLRGEKGD